MFAVIICHGETIIMYYQVVINSIFSRCWKNSQLLQKDLHMVPNESFITYFIIQNFRIF